MTTVINGNLTVNGTVSAYLDTSLNSLPENAISFFGNLVEVINGMVVYLLLMVKFMVYLVIAQVY
jgi:hypothetical protein